MDGGAGCVGAPASGRARHGSRPGAPLLLAGAVLGAGAGLVVDVGVVLGVGGGEQVAGQVGGQGPVPGQVGRGRVAGERMFADPRTADFTQFRS
ncbi:hypothetical protein [Ornithinimicrobium kibberense]|uniref:hypothetical protein n=1 Tax=Ornithinimicrobium kibberense TaxID=282060 RepID=UPI00361BEDCB